MLISKLSVVLKNAKDEQVYLFFCPLTKKNRLGKVGRKITISNNYFISKNYFVLALEHVCNNERKGIRIITIKKYCY